MSKENSLEIIWGDLFKQMRAEFPDHLDLQSKKDVLSKLIGVLKIPKREENRGRDGGRVYFFPRAEIERVKNFIELWKVRRIPLDVIQEWVEQRNGYCPNFQELKPTASSGPKLDQQEPDVATLIQTLGDTFKKVQERLPTVLDTAPISAQDIKAFIRFLTFSTQAVHYYLEQEKRSDYAAFCISQFLADSRVLHKFVHDLYWKQTRGAISLDDDFSGYYRRQADDVKRHLDSPLGAFLELLMKRSRWQPDAGDSVHKLAIGILYPSAPEIQYNLVKTSTDEGKTYLTTTDFSLKLEEKTVELNYEIQDVGSPIGTKWDEEEKEEHFYHVFFEEVSELKTKLAATPWAVDEEPPSDPGSGFIISAKASYKDLVDDPSFFSILEEWADSQPY